jgi:hypothetical protein
MARGRELDSMFGRDYQQNHLNIFAVVFFAIKSVIKPPVIDGCNFNFRN